MSKEMLTITSVYMCKKNNIYSFLRLKLWYLDKFNVNFLYFQIFWMIRFIAVWWKYDCDQRLESSIFWFHKPVATHLFTWNCRIYRYINSTRVGLQHFLQDRMCVGRILKSECASVQSDQSLRRAPWRKPMNQSVLRWTAKILISLCNIIGNALPRLIDSHCTLHTHLNSFGAKFQTTFVVCFFFFFFILTNYRFERRLYVKFKD